MATITQVAKVLNVTKTTAQWEVESTIVSKGLLCVEITTTGETRLKVGDGAKTYAQLPYVSDGSFKISDYYTKTEADTAITDAISALGNVLNIKGIVATETELPTENNEAGDLWFVGTADDTTDSYSEYVWTTAGKWEYLGRVQTEVDLSDYATIEYVDAEIKKITDQLTPLQSTVDTHVADTNIHVTADKQAAWNQAVTDLGTHTADTVAHITAEERAAWNNKVDKVEGKALSTNDLTDELLESINAGLTKLDGIEEGSNKITVDTELSETSTNPVENKAVNAAISAVSGDVTALTERVEANEGVAHSHENGDVLDAIEEAYTTAEKTKLAGIEEGANKTVVDTELSAESTNPVENKAVKAAIDSVNEVTDGLDERVVALEEGTVKATDTLVLNCEL